MNKMLPAVIGHWGAAAYAPENTCSGFEMASTLGAKWVEFDVRLTQDQQAIVFHDEDLQRTSDGDGLISELTWKDLGQYDVGSWFDSAYSNERIPTLLDTISILKKLGLGANVEIKSSDGRECESGQLIAELLQQHWPKSLPPVLVSSFSPECLLTVKDESPDISRALIMDEVPSDWEKQLQVLGCEGLHCRHDKLKKQVAGQITERGYSLRCFTVNNSSRAKELFSWGIEFVFTDYPDRIRQQ
jgi:glycerophosphoryl diester phosphodiesterase